MDLNYPAEAGNKDDLPSPREESAKVPQTSFWHPVCTPPSKGAPGTSHKEEAMGVPQATLVGSLGGFAENASSQPGHR